MGLGKNMPSGSWKQEQRKFKEEHRLSPELAKTFEEIVADIDNKNNNIHNTLYHDEFQISAICLPDQQVRPPPWLISLSSRQFQR